MKLYTIMKLKLFYLRKILFVSLMMLSLWSWGQAFQLSSGNYSENFSDIANWSNGFSAGNGAQYWKSVVANSTGTLGDGVKTTTSSATFATSSSAGGIQKGTNNLYFLSTSTNNSVAVDLLLDFTGRVAGTMSFDLATVFNGNGNRDSILKLFYSLNNGSTFTEITGTNIPYTGRNNVTNNVTANITLPSSFNNVSNVILRFYEYSTNGGGASISGSQPKISIDNVSITSTAGNTPTIYTATSTNLDSFQQIYGNSQTDVRSFNVSGENLQANISVTPPSNWEISLSQNTGFTTSAISLSPSGNTVSQTNIYVRLASSNAIGSYSGNIVISSAGANDKNILVSGNVKIAVPIANPATNIGNSSFNANWDTVQGATGFYLDVYKVLPVTTSEGFSNAPTAPSGWVFNGIESYPAGGIAGPSLKFADSNDRITSPAYSNEIKELKFWILGNGTTTATPSYLLVEGFNGSSWVTIENISPISTSGTTYTYNATSTTVLPSNLSQFRFTYTKGAGNLSFDDFSIIQNQKNFVTGFENKSLSSVQTALVDNLTPATDYFYAVRTTNGTVTSATSNVIAVTTTSNTTWTNSGWTSGTPSSNIDAIITESYSTSSNPTFTAKNIIIKNGGVLEITSGNTINAVDVTIENGGNFIQRDGSTLNNTGTFNVLKTGASAQNKYAFWSSPVLSQNLSNIYGATAPAFITEYDTATDYFVNASSTTAVAGKAYSIKTPSANASLTFSGTPVNDNQTFTLSVAGNGFNLVGNPYASNLDLNAFYTANSGKISNTFYFWDNTSNSVTTQSGSTTTNVGYATYNPASQTWVPAPNISAVPAGNTASIGQGFIVKATNASDTSLNFTNAMRIGSQGAYFNKSVANVTEGKFWLQLSSSYNTQNTFAVAYLSQASHAYDQYDSKAIASGSDAFYTLADAEKLVIQGKGNFDINDVIPVGAKHFEGGDFVISMIKKEGLFNSGQPVYLHDKVLNTYTNLQNNNYHFTASAGEVSNRFEIVYKDQNVLSVSDHSKKEAFEVYRNGEEFVVRNDKNIQSVEVYDASGRIIIQLKNNKTTVNFRLNTNGAYIVKAVSEGKEYSRKIIK